ncbi:MAG: C40 family peptidase [Sandaracinus sp.]|nr:C40 family peptidase [Sandaracinus sp.]
MRRCLLLTMLLACGGNDAASGGEIAPSGPTSASAGTERPDGCPAQAPAPTPLPNVTAAHETLAYWLERSSAYGDPDDTLLSASELRDHARALRSGDDPARQPDLGSEVDLAALEREVRERLTYVEEKLTSEAYVSAEGTRADDALLAELRVPSPLPTVRPELRVVLAPTSMRCAPSTASFYTPSRDLAFDRNACSLARAQEPLELLARWPNGMWLARTRYALGWIAGDAPLSPAVPEEHAAAVLGPRVRLMDALSVEGGELAEGTLVAPSEAGVLLGTRTGFASTPARATPTERPLTRRAFLERAFGLLGSPYGWGGHEGGRDCSRYLLDLFADFGLPIPRHSARQALAGTYAIDVEPLGPTEKLLLIETAQRKGIVLLHFPGHIMLYLGRDAGGRPYALHSFSEYVEPCEGTDDGEGHLLETLRRVDRVAVSDLSLGEGSSRRDFLSRVTRVVVFGQAPGPELRGAATLRPAAPTEIPATCDDSVDARVFKSPYRPNQEHPLRVIVSASEDPGPVALTLFDPRGRRVETPTHWLGGPPFSVWAEIQNPTAGAWTAVLGDGSRIVACERVVVARFAPEVEPRPASGAAWEPSWSWERDTENLFAAFVEQLFREPEGEETTWPSLQALIADRERNLLHDHRMGGEEGELDLQPDCADLPYFLRAYFSWKLRLPFAWRQCSRGREGRAPACTEVPKTNLDPVEGHDEVTAFRALLRELGRNVHSSTNRTLPNDDATDVYPVPMTREAIRPGTVYADPYGHVLVVARWVPQSLSSYGMLLAADAQPDAVVGRRRFWRGSFLFSTETTEAGAGFKAWRPPVYDRRERTITLPTNDELRSSRDYVRWSDAQYRGSVDDFYDAMDGLINPRPLDPRVVQRSLVDALEESVVRRVVSIDTGEAFMRERGFRPIDMPDDADIFQTEGPWEDFSTPSRDLRLLVSLDAVTGFPDAVERNPSRFGIEGDASATVRELREWLVAELGRRGFDYTRSDGQTQHLTLAQIVERSAGFEMAYNPNDCVEVRWGAPEGSPERGSCRRSAPREQRAKMQRYRSWFENRHRPAR